MYPIDKCGYKLICSYRHIFMQKIIQENFRIAIILSELKVCSSSVMSSGILQHPELSSIFDIVIRTQILLSVKSWKEPCCLWMEKTYFWIHFSRLDTFLYKLDTPVFNLERWKFIAVWGSKFYADVHIRNVALTFSCPTFFLLWTHFQRIFLQGIQWCGKLIFSNRY